MRFPSPSINWCGIRKAMQIAEIRFSICTSYLNCNPLQTLSRQNVPATLCYLARTDKRNFKKFLIMFPCQKRDKRQKKFENLWAVYLWETLNTNLFYKNVQKIVTLACVMNCICWYNFYLLFSIVVFLIAYDMQKNIRQIKHIFVHTSFCVLNCMLSECRTNFAEIAGTTKQFEQASSSDCFFLLSNSFQASWISKKSELIND